MIQLGNFEITAENVGKVVQRFRSSELPRLEMLWKYYRNENEILNRKEETGKPNNKLACAYARYIVTMQTGYFMGINVKHNSSNKEYLEEYKKILEDNFEEDVNFELAKSASIYGYGIELIYQNEQSETKFKKLDPREVILVFGTSLNEFLHAAIRFYRRSDLDGKWIEVAEVYSKRELAIYERGENEQEFRLVYEPKEHLFSDLPVIVYKNNEEMKSDFEDQISIQNAYDTAQSNTANDIDYFNDAYMVIEGSNDVADEEYDYANGSGDMQARSNQTAETLKRNRLMFFPDGGKAYYLMKDVNDSATENYKNRLNGDIHKFSMTPDLADEKFAGNLSGIAIRFKTIPLEQAAKPRENKFRVGFRKRRELITQILNITKNRAYQYMEISEEFTRNLPQNEQEKTNTVLAMAEYISRRTFLELLPQIEDVDEELKRLEAEREEYNQLDYDFSRLATKSDVIRDDELGVLEN